MDEAEYCNRLALMFRGRLVALGTPTELKLQRGEGRPDAARMRVAGTRAGRSFGRSTRCSDAAVFGNALHVVVRGRRGADARDARGDRAAGGSA